MLGHEIFLLRGPMKKMNYTQKQAGMPSREASGRLLLVQAQQASMLARVAATLPASLYPGFAATRLSVPLHTMASPRFSSAIGRESNMRRGRGDKGGRNKEGVRAPRGLALQTEGSLSSCLSPLLLTGFSGLLRVVLFCPLRKRTDGLSESLGTRTWDGKIYSF